VRVTTRGDLRLIIRRKLNDSGLLWDDLLINDAIDEGIRRYSTRFPKATSTIIAVSAGAREISLPSTIRAARVVRVFDDSGREWEPWHITLGYPPAPFGPPGGMAIWRTWNDALILDSPAPRSGNWRIEHRADRALPTNDAATLDIEPMDDDLIIAIAVAVALQRRATDDAKHGIGGHLHPLADYAERAMDDADRMIRARHRAARMAA
jgi:hypothetical protein